MCFCVGVVQLTIVIAGTAFERVRSLSCWVSIHKEGVCVCVLCRLHLNHQKKRVAGSSSLLFPALN